MKRGRPGTLISGTMLNGDLGDVFLNELAALNSPRHMELRAAWQKLNTHVRNVNDSEEATDFVHGLFDALDEHSPPGFYFGANEGDGSDYGWWLDDIDMNEAEYILVTCGCNPKADGLEVIPFSSLASIVAYARAVFSSDEYGRIYTNQEWSDWDVEKCMEVPVVTIERSGMLRYHES